MGVGDQPDDGTFGRSVRRLGIRHRSTLVIAMDASVETYGRIASMGLLIWLLVGLFCGAVARMIVPGSRSFGCIGTSLLGIIGSLVGGTVFNALGGRGFEPASSGIIGSIFGAAVLLVLGKIVSKQ
jgi:uncharacterized membrane protein YeaQ/YmgE (transglycosylase-associated protein family)